MKQILILLAIAFAIPQMSLAQGSCSFNAQEYSKDSCCIIIHAKCSTDNTAWQVLLDGTTTYDYTDYYPGFGPNILVCFTENGNHTVDFYVNGNYWWTDEVNLNGCEPVDCCEAPDAAGLTVTPSTTQPNVVDICLEEPPCEAEATFRCRVLGTTQWTIFGTGDFCAIEGVELCQTYEFQAAYVLTGCDGVPEYSESVIYETECPCCEAPDAAGLTITPAPAPWENGVEVCLETIACADVEATFRYKVAGTDDWVYFGNEDFCVIIGLDPCETYEFQAAYYTPECNLTEYSESVIYKAECETDCCRTPDDFTITPIDLTCQNVQVCIPGFENCDIFGYFVRYRPQGTFSWSSQFSQNSCGVISGLNPNQVYEFRVATASFGCGLSASSPTQTYDMRDCINRPIKRTGLRSSGDQELSNSIASTKQPKVFPNPFTESIQLAFFAVEGEQFQFDLFDINGKLIRTQRGVTTMGYNELQINERESLTTGVYLYRLSTGSQNYSNRLYKQ